MNRKFAFYVGMMTVAVIIVVAISVGSRPSGTEEVEEEKSPVDQVSVSVYDDDTLELVLKRIESKNLDVRLNAILALGKYGDQFEKIMHPLAASLATRDELVKRAAVITVDNLGDSIVEPVKTVLQSGESKQILAACEIIHAMGPTAAPCVDQLIELMKSDDPIMVRAAVYGLVNIGPQASAAVESLIPILDEADFRDQILALRALAAIGPASKPAATKVLELLEKGNGSIRGHASMAIGAMGEIEGVDVDELLSKQLDAFLMPEKQRALIAIAGRGEASRSLAPKIKTLMNDPQKSVPIDAAIAYWKTTGDGKTAIEALTKYAKNLDYEFEAIDGFGRMGPDAAPAIPFLIEKLKSTDRQFEMHIADALSQMGAAAKPARGVLAIILDSNDPLVRAYAKRALANIAAADENADKN